MQQPIKTNSVKVKKEANKKSPIFAMMSVFAIMLIGTSLTLSYLEVSGQDDSVATAKNGSDAVKPMEHYTVASNLTDTNVESEQNETFLKDLHANTINTQKIVDEKSQIVDNSQSDSKDNTLDDLVITLGENNNDQKSEKETTASKPSLDVSTKQESQLDEKEFEIVDDVDKIIADMDSDEEEGSEFYNDFKEASSNYRKFRLDIFNDKRHRDDYNKLMDFYRDDIENGTYKIGLASEIDNDTVVVDVSRGVVVYE